MLYLFPNVLDESQSHEQFFPRTVGESVSEIEGIIAENEKSARAFLKRFTFSNGRSFREIPIKLLNEHTTEPELKELLTPLLEQKKWGLISDCGLPCLADPGARLVALAHKHGVAVKTFPGPSSIVMALMLSGLHSQQFTFHGYLPREVPLLIAKLKTMELDVAQRGMTQLFIEAPYRNQKLLEILIETLSSSLFLCVASDVSLETEKVITLPVFKWKTQDVAYYQKRPSVFLFGKI
jgi:16S rRNA (cytidine1402-2'-O)-methyltransferase